MPADILIVPNRGSSTLNPAIQFSGSAVNTIRLEALQSGSVAFLGSSGSLFSVVDNLSGSLMAVSDISGLPILEVFSDDRVVMGKYNSNALVVTGSRVGVGKTAPTTTLDVSGNVFMTGSLTMTGSLNPLGVAETYTTANPSSNVITIDVSKATVFNSTLTANVTSFTINGSISGRMNCFTLFLSQDGTGGRTVTWTFTGKTLKWGGSTAPTMTSTLNKTDVYTFMSNDGGTTWYGFVGGQNF